MYAYITVKTFSLCRQEIGLAVILGTLYSFKLTQLVHKCCSRRVGFDDTSTWFMLYGTEQD